MVGPGQVFEDLPVPADGVLAQPVGPPVSLSEHIVPWDAPVHVQRLEKRRDQKLAEGLPRSLLDDLVDDPVGAGGVVEALAGDALGSMGKEVSDLNPVALHVGEVAGRRLLEVELALLHEP